MKQSLYQNYFKGKHITVMGLGLLGRGVQVTQFLIDCGANVTVTDLKTKTQLKTSLAKLQPPRQGLGGKVRFVLGKHTMKDFERCDMVVKAAGVPLDSPYIAHAKKHGVDVVMDASLFVRLVSGRGDESRRARLAPMVDIVGVTGTRGKSMTTSAIYHVLKSQEKVLGCKVYSGGNLRGQATLPLLKKVKANDIVVLELDSWQCQGFGDEKISPAVAVFTSFMEDHQNYYNNSMKKYFVDKANIYKYQNKGDVLVLRPAMKKWIAKSDVAGKLIIANKNSLNGTKLQVLGEHQVENLACAFEVAKLFGLKENVIRKSLSGFKGLEGRMELLREVRGIKIYNDNNATTPEATIAGLKALALGKRQKAKGKSVILIAGGNDKEIALKGLSQAIKKYTKRVYFLPGTGTHRYLREKHYQKDVLLVRNLAEAVKLAMKEAKKGDTILFSPAFSSFSQYANEYERNDEFVKIVKNLK